MKRLLYILGFLLMSYNAVAQTLTVSAPSVVSMDETFRVEFTANGNVTDFNWEPGSDFAVVWGPQRGSSSSISIINGKRESTHTETYTYLLQPTKEGKFTLPGASANVNKTACNSGTFAIEVVPAQEKQQGGEAGAAASSQQNLSTVAGEDLFLRLTLSKTNVVKGEPITASLILYSRADISGFEDVKFPTFNGFWSKETYTPSEIKFNRENIDGKIYDAAVLRRYMLIPQQEGAITIDPAEMVCQVRVRTSSTGPRSIFDDFFDSFQTIRKRVNTPAITVNVKGLPAGAPASFAGGVGQFRISAVASKDSLSANDAASIKVTVSGTGNISMLEVPKINFPADFEVYDVKTSESIDSNGTGGTKTFEYPFIPRSYGSYKIGPIEYSYYDIKAGRYITVSAPELVLNVSPGAEVSSGGQLISGAVRQSVRNIDEDIRYIHVANPRLKEKDSFLVKSPLFYIILAIIAALFFVVLGFANQIAKNRADLIGTKNKRANKLAKSRLKIAESYMKQNLSSAYYEELHKAVLGYLSDKLAISASELSKENISDSLRERGIAEELIGEVNDILDDCEMARYSPDQTSEKMQVQFNKSLTVISELESKLNIKKKMKPLPVVIAALLMAGSVTLYGQSLTLTPEPEQTAPAVEVITDDPVAAWEKANELYSDGNYQAALAQYLALEASGKVSATLYYNTANAYYRMGNLSKSILYYERALKADPNFSDAKENLTIAHTSVLDKIDTLPDFILVTWIRNLKNSVASDGWAWITLALALITAVLLLMFRLLPSQGGRKASFIVGCVAALFAVITLLFSVSSANDATKEDSAIVMLPVSSVKSSPDANSKSLFILHEGTKVELIDNLGNWVRVELSDGRQGWMPASDIEII
ncbi:MAG: BatD family protein [Bacteroidales bacterium]|nr:BatD family protein [Bacteroidales bacterium]